MIAPEEADYRTALAALAISAMRVTGRRIVRFGYFEDLDQATRDDIYLDAARALAIAPHDRDRMGGGLDN